ncbi:MAG: radical SAM protein [Planctomycetota bacterium]
MLPEDPGQPPPTTPPEDAAPGALAAVEEQARPVVGPAPGHWSRRRTFHPGSLPRHMAITVLDLDVTKRRNLRCRYCFKSDRVQPDAPDMTPDTAFAAVDWLMAASYRASELWVNLFGGEPLLQFPLIRQLVPYAKRRAQALGKSIQFGCTTNLTLIDEEVAAFFLPRRMFRRWARARAGS